MIRRHVDFVNQCDRTWTLGVYQTLAAAPTLDSVSWRQATAARGGYGWISWDLACDVCLADYREAGGRGVFWPTQVLPAALGSRWRIVFEDGIQQLLEDGSGTLPDGLEFVNESGRPADPGYGMAGSGAVYARDVGSDRRVQVPVEPIFWAGLFHQLQPGEVISLQVLVGPLEIRYPPGLNLCTLTAQERDDGYVLTATYGSAAVKVAAELDERTGEPQGAGSAG